MIIFDRFPSSLLALPIAWLGICPCAQCQVKVLASLAVELAVPESVYLNQEASFIVQGNSKVDDVVTVTAVAEDGKEFELEMVRARLLILDGLMSNCDLMNSYFLLARFFFSL